MSETVNDYVMREQRFRATAEDAQRIQDALNTTLYAVTAPTEANVSAFFRLACAVVANHDSLKACNRPSA